MTTRGRQPGEFCWINILTPRPHDAMQFLGEVLDWTFPEMPGIGHGIKVGNRDVGGLFDFEGPNVPPGSWPHIGVMVKVESADETGKKVQSLGGTAHPPFDVFNAGRMAVCFDPNGAGFDVWQPRSLQGFDVDPRTPGAPTWFETLTTDVDRAVAFYTKLFGWTAVEMPYPFRYVSFRLGDLHVGGAMQITPEMGDLKPNWSTYVTVASADAAARIAKEAGGTICVPAQDIPNIGRFCGITSPQGITFFVMEYR